MKAFPGAALALITTGLISGCTTTVATMPPPAGLPFALGRVVIEARANTDHLALDVPDSKADVLADKPRLEPIPADYLHAPISPGMDAAEFLAETAVIFATSVTAMVGSSLAHELYRPYGLVMAESDATIESARKTLSPLVDASRLDRSLGEKIREEFAAGRPDIELVTSRRAADTVVELMIFEPKIAGGGGPNPELRLRFGLRVRVLDARTGHELFYDYLQYRGRGHGFADWAANEASVFRAEIGRCVANLSSEVAALLAGRPEGTVPTGASLAALGITHRIPATTSQPISPMLLPPRVRYSYTD